MSLGLIIPIHLLSQERDAYILEHKSQVQISKVNILNSPYRETNLSITPDGNLMFFMSMRGGQFWSNSYMTFREDSVFDGDIWYSKKRNGRWTAPQSLPHGINTKNGQDEPNISVDGKTIYYQSWRYSYEIDGGPYYKAEREGTSWGAEVGLGGGITEFFRTHKATDGMAISPDEKLFIVAADRYEYDGAMDIYYSRKTKYGWTYCMKLPISTNGDERSVFLAADGRTLYFASDGYRGYGGLDIFKTTLNPDGTVGKVVNIGAPFNTPKDDYGFILTADGSEAYFVRNGDIYFANLKELDESIKPQKPNVQVVLQGTVKDSSSWTGLPANVLILDARTKRLVKQIATSNSGSYKIDLPNESRVYDQIIACKGYPKAKRRIHINKTYRDAKYQSDFLLTKPEPEPVIAKLPDPERPKEKISEENRMPLEEIGRKPTPNLSDSQPNTEIGAVIRDPDPYNFEGIAENNLVLLLDVSASMRKPDKLPLLKEALRKMLVHLRQEDLISILIYSGDAKVVLDGVSAINKHEIIDAIDKLSSGGATKGKLALRKAYRVAEQHFIAEGNNRILLATDGYFEVSDLYNLASKSALKNVSLSVFSFGKLMDRKMEELERLADLGNGNYSSVSRKNVDEALLKELKAVRK